MKVKSQLANGSYMVVGEASELRNNQINSIKGGNYMFKERKRFRAFLILMALLVLVPIRADAQKKPSVKRLQDTSVALSITKFAFGAGLIENSAYGLYKGQGMQIIPERICGSGFLVDKEGTIITNFHVASKIMSGEAQFDDGSRYEIRHIKKYDRVNDIAILKISANKEFKRARLGNSNKIKLLDDVYAVGNGHCEGLSFTNGTLNQIRKDDYGKYLQFRHNATILAGNSGGPLYHGDEVIGINRASLIYQEVHYAIPINIAKELLKPPWDKQIVRFSDAFPTDPRQIADKANQLYAETGEVSGAAGENEPGFAIIPFNFHSLQDYFITLEGVPGSNLALVVINPRNEYIGISYNPEVTSKQLLLISSDYAQAVNIGVVNYSSAPANVGVTVYGITW